MTFDFGLSKVLRCCCVARYSHFFGKEPCSQLSRKWACRRSLCASACDDSSVPHWLSFCLQFGAFYTIGMIQPRGASHARPNFSRSDHPCDSATEGLNVAWNGEWQYGITGQNKPNWIVLDIFFIKMTFISYHTHIDQRLQIWVGKGKLFRVEGRAES